MSDPVHNFAQLDAGSLPTPCYVLDLQKLEDNLKILKQISDATGVDILLALKAFSAFAVSDLIDEYLQGMAASGLWEARLGKTRFSGAVHTYAPGLKPDHFDELISYSDHVIFNSVSQLSRFREKMARAGDTEFGLRLNPRHSLVDNPLYDPSAAWSRLGVPPSALNSEILTGLSGVHVHGLCDSGFKAFEEFLKATENTFSAYFPQLDWINLGGGHLMTDPTYPTDELVEALKGFSERSGLKLYLEPGTAVALNAGALVTEVVDLGHNDGHFTVVDASATCHMPDVIEAPYTPEVLGAEICETVSAKNADDPCVRRLFGPTCLSGDVIGTYHFDQPPQIGDRLILLDQAYYTMVKNSTFNGMPLPSIVLWDPRKDDLNVIKDFDYELFESRLS